MTPHSSRRSHQGALTKLLELHHLVSRLILKPNVRKTSLTWSLAAHARHQAHHDAGMHQRGPDAADPSALRALQYRWRLPSAHGVPWWSMGTLPWPLGTRNSLQRGGYERLDGQLITRHAGRAENPLVVKSVQLA